MAIGWHSTLAYMRRIIYAPEWNEYSIRISFFLIVNLLTVYFGTSKYDKSKNPGKKRKATMV